MSNEKKAKKSASAESIIVRTTLITFAALIGLSALFLLLFPLCFPSAAANTCDRLGMDSVAARYYKVAYERDKTAGNFENYFTKLRETDRYKDLSAMGDDLLELEGKLDGRKFTLYAMTVVEAKYETGDKDGSAKFAVTVGDTTLNYAKAKYSGDSSYLSLIEKYENDK